MTDNNQLSTKLHKPEPKYRKKLNQEQVEVLQMLYRFRFASSEQIAQFQAKPNAKAIQKRLKILEDQDLIAKRYDKSYKLQGKPAAYYLTPTGARAFAANIERKPDEPLNMKRLYTSKDASEGFITHCRNVLSVYLALKALHPKQGELMYFTKNQLSYEKYDDYFPSPRQDAYVHIRKGQADRHFLLDIFEDTQPFFVLIRRIKKYLDYSSGGDWEAHSDKPLTILMVVGHKSIHKRLRKRLAYELRESYEDLKFATTRLEHILEPKYKGKVWFPIDEDGDDPDEPLKPVTLTKLPQADN
ncbi:MAG TPA: replication-relaxation family protein [Candidatus Saccharimonadales bacterium]|nr:replication-relaxation family protein [Candidatus Saccharimonadales bacterium]